MFLRTLCVGHYVFLETSRPLNPQDKARLISPYIGLKVACLKFWYHSFGDNAHMGELQLIIKSDTVSIILNAQMTYMWWWNQIILAVKSRQFEVLKFFFSELLWPVWVQKVCVNNVTATCRQGRKVPQPDPNQCQFRVVKRKKKKTRVPFIGFLFSLEPRNMTCGCFFFQSVLFMFFFSDSFQKEIRCQKKQNFWHTVRFFSWYSTVNFYSSISSFCRAKKLSGRLTGIEETIGYGGTSRYSARGHIG